MKYLIVDDHPLILDALRAELADGNLCLLARSLGESLTLVEQYPDIDLIILDLGLPDSQGIQGLIRLRAAVQNIPVLILSASTDRAEIEKALNFGAAGFVPKTTAMAVLQQAIQVVLLGGIYVPLDMDAMHQEEQRSIWETNIYRDLTPREKAILPLLVLGLSNKAIAKRLCLSTHTVRTHVAHILNKLNISNRAQVGSKVFLST